MILCEFGFIPTSRWTTVDMEGLGSELEPHYFAKGPTRNKDCCEEN